MKKRRIIYVDASTTKKKSKISLYDTKNKRKKVLELKSVSNNNTAEKYAVLYAISYIKQNGYKNCHILSDNTSAVDNKKLLKLAYKNKITISWVPREANTIADKLSRSKVNQKTKEVNGLRFLYQLVFKKDKKK